MTAVNNYLRKQFCINFQRVYTINATQFKHSNVYLCVLELLLNIFYNRSAVKADKNTANELWMNRVCANYLACDLCQCSNPSRC